MCAKCLATYILNWSQRRRLLLLVGCDGQVDFRWSDDPTLLTARLLCCKVIQSQLIQSIKQPLID